MTVLWVAFAVLCAWGQGLCFVAAAWPRRGEQGLRAALALPLGVGLSSAWCFLWGLAFGVDRPALLAYDAGLWGLLLVVLCLRRGRDLPPSPAADLAAPAAGWLRAAGLLALLAAGVAVLATFVALPHGNGDAISIWNMRAHFLHQAWGQWPLVLFQLGLAHVDYPLQLPVSVVRLWGYAGERVGWAPMVAGGVFAAGCVAVLHAALRNSRGPAAAWLATAVLCGTPFFVQHAAEQAADIAVACFVLAAVAAAVRGAVAAAALAAGCAAWTKDEGALFALLLLGVGALGWLLTRRWSARWSVQPLAALLLGASLPVAALLVFKIALAPPSELLATGSDAPGIGARLSDGARHATVLDAIVRRLWMPSADGAWWPVGWGCGPGLLAGYAVLVGRAPGARLAWVPALALLGMVAAYYAYFVGITPHILDWHLRTALGRVLLQLWPAMVLVCFAWARVPAAVARR